MHLVTRVKGIDIYYDSYEGGIFLNIQDAASCQNGQLKEICKWFIRNQRALDLLDMYSQAGNNWSDFFCDEGDLQHIINSEIVSDHAKERARWILEYGFNVPYPQKKHKEKVPTIQSGYVYILKGGPFYKIGCSENVGRRIKKLATLPPFDIELIHTVETDDMYSLEKELHKRFADKRKNGEWFELDDEDVEYLKSLSC